MTTSRAPPTGPRNYRTLVQAPTLPSHGATTVENGGSAQMPLSPNSDIDDRRGCVPEHDLCLSKRKRDDGDISDGDLSHHGLRKVARTTNEGPNEQALLYHLRSVVAQVVDEKQEKITSNIAGIKNDVLALQAFRDEKREMAFSQSDQLQELEHDLSGYRNANKDNEAKYDEHDRMLKKLEEGILDHKDSLTRKASTIADMKKVNQSIEQKFDKRLTELKAENRKLKDQLNKGADANSKLAEQVTKMEIDLTKSEKQRDLERTQQNKTLLRLDKDTQKCLSDVKNSRKEDAAKNTILEQQIERIHELERLRKEDEKKITTLEDRDKEWKTQFETQANHTANIASKVETLEAYNNAPAALDKVQEAKASWNAFALRLEILEAHDKSTFYHLRLIDHDLGLISPMKSDIALLKTQQATTTTTIESLASRDQVAAMDNTITTLQEQLETTTTALEPLATNEQLEALKLSIGKDFLGYSTDLNNNIRSFMDREYNKKLECFHQRLQIVEKRAPCVIWDPNVSAGRQAAPPHAFQQQHSGPSHMDMRPPHPQMPWGPSTPTTVASFTSPAPRPQQTVVHSAGPAYHPVPVQQRLGPAGFGQAVNAQAITRQAINVQAVNARAVNAQPINGQVINAQAIKAQAIKAQAITAPPAATALPRRPSSSPNF